MNRTLAIGLVALLAACSSEKKKEIQWGAPQPPTDAEKAAVADSLATLQANLTYQQTTDPESGVAGFADQLVESLSSATASGPGTSAKLSQDLVRQAMTGTCGVPTFQGEVTTYTWTSCQIDGADTGITMLVTIDGWMTWNPTLGETKWQIDETVSTTWPMGDATLQDDATAHMAGAQTVTATTIDASTSAAVQSHAVYQGPEGTFSEDSTGTTTLDMNLDYTAGPPFCITGGTIEVVQHQQPAFPEFQGFELTFTGTDCSAFVITKGS